ncbi:MAG: GNAT family N-acetyltransferase [Actinomycetota bacterium]|nr:GNAT family N-acetyltransferase [Actinomycetota bacterium]
MMPPRFRLAGPADIDAVVALVESAYRGEPSRQGWTTEADLLEGQRTDVDEVAADLTRSGSAVLLAEDPGPQSVDSPPILLACCHIERRVGGSCYFGLFAVRPTHQGRGIGRAVVAEADRIAGEWGCVDLRMQVIRQRGDLIAWYQRLGFRPTGETVPFPYGDERFGRPKRHDLQFVVLARRILAQPRQ